MDYEPKVLFVYDHPNEKWWKDGLWAAIELLDKTLGVRKVNIHGQTINDVKSIGEQVVLGWGAFHSSTDLLLQSLHAQDLALGGNKRFGLCLGGYGFAPSAIEIYDVLFYETEWSKEWLRTNSNDPVLPKLVHAFGVNTDIFRPLGTHDLWDYMTVGAFSDWKRQDLLLNKPGVKLAVGQIQKDNLYESMGIVSRLVSNGVMVADETAPETLVKLYGHTNTVYIPAHVLGGGERSILEARACGCRVEAELDNPKLQELLPGGLQVWDHNYYAAQLKKGIESCLNSI